MYLIRHPELVWLLATLLISMIAARLARRQAFRDIARAFDRSGNHRLAQVVRDVGHLEESE